MSLFGLFGLATMAGFVTLLGVLPATLWLTKRRRVPLRETLLFGIGFGILPFVIGTSLADTHGTAGLLRGLVFSSLLGVVGAAVFRAIALREREQSRHR